MEQHVPIAGPLVSCLCVTEGRSAFMPWLLWCFDRQNWPQRELLIFDSSPEPLQVAGRPNVRVVAVPPGTGVAAKRNLALREMRGDLVAWFDDDDWQHPERLSLLVQALSSGAVYAGTRRAWFVDLATRRCSSYAGNKTHVIFNSAGFRADAARRISFPENVRVASDTQWLAALTAQFPAGGALVDRQDLGFWLCHGSNLSNPAYRHACNEPLQRLKDVAGSGAWGDTDAALDALQARLAPRSETSSAARPAHKPAVGLADRAKGSVPRRPTEQSSASAPRDEAQTPVAVTIKATVLDAPFLDTMVRHMLHQAHYPFAERLIVVDRRSAFSGKYRDRPCPHMRALDDVLERLLADRVIDGVRDVDMHPKRVRETTECYFREHAARVPTHAATGGPIYSTLYGLEVASCDTILQMDADVFFYSDAQSWLSQALSLMLNDPQLWLMMTHPGPPAGLPGNSMGKANAQRSTWDGELNMWRFRHATTRYFLCDRRRLRGRLRPLAQAGGCAPLEQCLSQALQEYGAFRGALGDLKSWHLHAWYHGAPFPEWAPALAKLIAEGRFPALQAGEYDLRLDRDHVRRQWGAIVAGTGAASRAPARGANAIRDGENTSTTTTVAVPDVSGSMPPRFAQHEAPLAVIIPVRNRAGQRLRNTLHGLNWQAPGRPAQIFVVSHGSRPEVDQELGAICAEQGATLVLAGRRSEPWNKSLALNIGIRRTDPSLPFVMTMDADMILAPNFLEVVRQRLQRGPKSLVLCRISDLPKHISLPTDPVALRQLFDRLRHTAILRSHTGSGGIQAAKRTFFFEIRGYDEDLLWWGAMDGDLLIRARLMNLEHSWIDNETAMLHQWHPRKHAGLSDPGEIQQARNHWLRNHELVRARASLAKRNPMGWGGEVHGA